MAATVNIDKFHNDFQNNPNFKEIIKQINRSPTMVNLINRYPGTIQQGDPNSGVYFKHGIFPSQDIINIPKDWINLTSNPEFRGKFVTMLGHELGHAVEGKELSKNNHAKTPQKYARHELLGEGIALTTEYRVAKELNVKMWSDGPGTLKTSYDALAKKHGIHTSAFMEAGKLLGANATRYKNPSTAPKLNYEQYYQTRAAVSMCKNAPPVSAINWKTVQPQDVTFTSHKDGTCTFTGKLAIRRTAEWTNLDEKITIQNRYSIENQPSDFLQQDFSNSVSDKALSPEIKALYQAVDSQLRPALEKLNVAEKHADAMIASMVLECVNKKMTADQFRDVGINTKQNLIIARGKGEFQFACIDAIAASRNDPEQTLALAQQQLEQQPHLEQQMQSQQMERQQQRSFGGMSM